MMDVLTVVKAQAFDLLSAEQQRTVQLHQMLQAIGQALGVNDYAQIIPKINELKAK